MSHIEISFEGYWQCRLATDPDPSDEQRGVSGFTYSVVGESLLEPSFWSQQKDIEKEYGKKAEEFIDTTASNKGSAIKNIREASSDYSQYNKMGIGLKVTTVSVNGNQDKKLTENLAGALVRFENRPKSNGPWKGPIFEGRNQIVSDGDPDRFTLNPFVLSISTDSENEETILRRFDPLDESDPDKQMWQINPKLPNFDEILERRLPKQRFALSNELLDQIGVNPTDLPNYFINRKNWLKSKIAESEAAGKTSLAEAFKSRYFAVDFFTQSTGPTVLENRLLSRIPLRQLYDHSIRGKANTEPKPYLNQSFFNDHVIDMGKEWHISYYMGAYDGDLLTGWSTGVITLPVKGES